jgi:rubrerythrin
MANLAYEWHNGSGSALYEFASNGGQIPEERVPQLLSEIEHCINVVSADPDSYDAEDKEKLEFLKKYVSDFHGTPQKKETPMAQDHNKLSNLKLAAEGGAEEEEATEEQTSVDSSIVALLESAKNEWTGLGDPVNPATWPKEVERAILALNDAIVKAIESTQAKLAEGDFYSKNVDEGVDSVGGGSATGIDDLNIAPAEPELNDELPMEEGPVDNKALVGDKKSSSKKAAIDPKTVCHVCGKVKPQLNADGECAECYAKSPFRDESVPFHPIASLKVKASSDIGSTETKKALKFTQDLSERIAGIFFDYKKTVEVANNSSLVKSAGEDMVRLKVKLNEVEKVLDKQLDVLTLAEDSIEDAKKQQAKKSSKVAKSLCSKCGEAFTPAKPDHKLCPSCHTSKKKASLFMGLTLASEE